MEAQTFKKDVRADERSASLGKSFSQTLRQSWESLAGGLCAVCNWLNQQRQFKRDLQREIFHRCLTEALHYPKLFKKARWQ